MEAEHITGAYIQSKSLGLGSPDKTWDLDPDYVFKYQCVIVGSGHAGSCAALAAIDAGCTKVLLIDKCTQDWAGGNGYFTAGAHRTVHAGLADLLPLLGTPLSEAEHARMDIDAYSADAFEEDIHRLGGSRADKRLVKAVVDGSREAVGWLREKAGVPFMLSANRQAYEVDGRVKFWGGMALSVEDGGKGLITAHHTALEKAGVEVWFEAKAVKLMLQDSEICGIFIEKDGRRVRVNTRSVVLAAGGFEANAKMRAKYLGEGWEHAHVRGTPYNTGDGFELARAAGAKLTGDWEGCHSTAWDANAAPDAGERGITNQYTKSGYPLGVMVNLHGRRFVDEGEDYRNYTYAKFGRAILQQPKGYAFQLWDTKMLGHLRKEEYGEGVVKKAWAKSLEEMAERLSKWGLEDKGQFLNTMHEFNDAVRHHRLAHPMVEWNPAVKDRLSTQSEHMKLEVPKTNWATTIDAAPFMAVKVACGITFTFGGLAIDPETAGVLSEKGDIIPGLFCAGEMVGGLFYGNYPGGSGLTAGAVFGMKAGLGAGHRK